MCIQRHSRYTLLLLLYIWVGDLRHVCVWNLSFSEPSLSCFRKQTCFIKVELYAHMLRYSEQHMYIIHTYVQQLYCRGYCPFLGPPAHIPKFLCGRATPISRLLCGHFLHSTALHRTTKKGSIAFPPKKGQ